MAYLIRPAKPVSEEIREIVRIQTDAAWETHGSEPDLHEKIRGIRRVIKRLRGLFRLVKYSIPADAYELADAQTRDAARTLSGFRDAAALTAALDRIEKHGVSSEAANELHAVREILQSDKQELLTNRTVESAMREALETLNLVAVRAGVWRFEAEGFSICERGLRSIYSKANRLLKEALAAGEPDVQLLHEWRKVVKYHWFHLNLLVEAWRPVLRVRAKQAEELGECLGDDHDCAVLDAKISGIAPNLTQAIKHRRTGLQLRAIRLGRHLFAEDPKDFAESMQRLWSASCPLEHKHL